MSEKIDLINERVSFFKCPICDKALGIEYKKVNYKDKEIKICKKHRVEIRGLK